MTYEQIKDAQIRIGMGLPAHFNENNAESTGQQGSSESRDAEINRLKKELAAANKGAERNAEINRNLAIEINELRANQNAQAHFGVGFQDLNTNVHIMPENQHLNAHSSHATLIEELVVLKAERDEANRKLNEALDALGKEKAALNQTLKKYQELEIVHNRLRVKVDAYRMFIEENMEMGHHGLPDYVIRFLKMLEDVNG